MSCFFGFLFYASLRGGLNGDCSALNFSGCDKSATTTTKTTLFVFLAVAVATIKAPIFYCLCSTNLRGPSPNRKSAFSNSLPFPLYPLQKLFFFLPSPPLPSTVQNRFPPRKMLLSNSYTPTPTHTTTQPSTVHCGSNGAVYYYGVERWWKEVAERGGKGSCSNSFLPPLPPCFISTQSMTTKHACQPEPCSRGVA